MRVVKAQKKLTQTPKRAKQKARIEGGSEPFASSKNTIIAKGDFFENLKQKQPKGNISKEGLGRLHIFKNTDLRKQTKSQKLTQKKKLRRSPPPETKLGAQIQEKMKKRQLFGVIFVLNCRDAIFLGGSGHRKIAISRVINMKKVL